MPKDLREKRARELLAQGDASIRDVLAASFGEWPPKGLDINPAPHHLSQHVIFKRFVNSVHSKNPLKIVWDYMGIGGRAYLSEERSIHINGVAMRIPRIIGGEGLSSVLGHEVVHSLQGDHYYRAKEVFGETTAHWIWTYQNGTAADMTLDEIKNNDANFKPSGLKDIFTAAAYLQRTKTYFEYMSTGTEIQARIHEIMMEGYQRWGRLPQNYNELWAALDNSGLTPPPDVLNGLKNLPADDPAQKFLSAKRGRIRAAGNIDSLNDILSDAGKKFFWQRTLPLLYVDLIEMYGDGPGRERFGFGKNPKAQLKQLPAPASVARR